MNWYKTASSAKVLYNGESDVDEHDVALVGRELDAALYTFVGELMEDTADPGQFALGVSIFAADTGRATAIVSSRLEYESMSFSANLGDPWGDTFIRLEMVGRTNHGWYKWRHGFDLQVPPYDWDPEFWNEERAPSVTITAIPRPAAPAAPPAVELRTRRKRWK